MRLQYVAAGISLITLLAVAIHLLFSLTLLQLHGLGYLLLAVFYLPWTPPQRYQSARALRWALIAYALVTNVGASALHQNGLGLFTKSVAVILLLLLFYDGHSARLQEAW